MAAEIDFQWQSFPAGSGSSRCRLRLLQLLDFIAVLLILTTCRHLVCLTLNDSNNLTNASLSYDPYLLDQLRYFEIELQRRKLPRWKRCSSSKFSRDDSFEFNISSNSGNEWRLLDRTVAEAHDRLRGRILFLLGDTYQASDIDMRIVSRSDDLDDLDNLHFSSGPSTFTMEYNLEDRASTICTEVSIVAYLRPLPKPNVKIFDVWTSSLDVAFDGDLNWEFGNLTVHSTYGNTWMGNYGSFDPPIIHNMSVSSVYGRIFGGLTPFGNVDVRSEHGTLGIFIHSPGRLNLPFEPKSITLSTISGDIVCLTGSPDWPEQVYTHRTRIESISGNISADVPHGSYTNISTVDGYILGKIKTYLSEDPPLTSEIYTSTQDGWTRFSFQDHSIPALKTMSHHRVGKGKMELLYPDKWYGDMVATIGHGEILVNATLLDVVERGDGFFKAKRGIGDSWMNVNVGVGSMYILIGPYTYPLEFSL